MSWNNLVEKSDMSALRGGFNIADLKKEDEVKEIMKLACDKVRTLKPLEVLDPMLSQFYMISKLTKFIKYNKNLLHLDLTCTGLTDQMLRAIGTALRRARSILSLHLSGNPGITPALKSFLYQRIRCCMPKPEMFDSQTSAEMELSGVIIPSQKTFDHVVGATLDKNVSPS